ncbi:hypothetical protein VSVS12_03731 [Vibrio scophthalmi]|nr:hypothetical protein VSVS12_03731 [Vibrio scophthalmi]
MFGQVKNGEQYLSAEELAMLEQFTRCDEDKCAALASETIRLLEIAGRYDKQLHYELQPIIKVCRKYQREYQFPLEHLLKFFKDTKTLSSLWFAAMVSATIPKNERLRPRFEEYKSLAVAAEFLLARQENTHTLRIDLPKRIRNIASSKSKNLLEQLPFSNQKSLFTLYQDTEKRQLYLRQNGEAKKLVNSVNDFKKMLLKLIKYIELVESKQEKISLNSESNIDQFEHHNDRSFLTEYENEIDQNETFLVDIKEISEDEIQDLFLPENDYIHEHKVAKAVNAQIRRNEMKLSCNVRRASSYEIRSLIEYCLTSKRDEKDKSARSTAMLMLLTGLSREALIKTNWDISDCGMIIGYRRQYLLPTSEFIDKEQAYLHNDTMVDFQFRLPLIFSIFSENSLHETGLEEKIRQLLKQINKKYRTHLTVYKISNFMHHYFVSRSADPVVGAIIRDADTRYLPAMHYTQLSEQKLSDYYQDYLNLLTNISKTRRFSIDNNDQIIQGVIGSGLPFNKAALFVLTKKLKKVLGLFTEFPTFTHIPEYHNVLTMYTHFVLTIATGYRPVRGWFGSIKDIDLISGMYWISDKEKQSGDSSRIIKLPSIAMTILTEYIDYLKHCKQYYQEDGNAILSRRYSIALDGSGHLLFWRTSTNRTDEMRPSTFMKQAEKYKIPFPQSNWYRHQIRSYLSSENLHPDLINAWMGHAHYSTQAFNRYSGLSFQDLDEVSQKINQLLKEIGVEGVVLC